MAKMKLSAKGYPNRFRNGREKAVQTNTQTDRHFRIYISRDMCHMYVHVFSFVCRECMLTFVLCMFICVILTLYGGYGL